MRRTPLNSVKGQLTRSGWHIDRKWLKENSESIPAKNDLVCGTGWDAICSTAFTKDNKKLFLVFSGTNEQIPLIHVDTDY